MQQRSGQELFDLKCNWVRDPIFDLYEADGFETHRNELEQFQRKAEDAWKFKAECDLEKKAQDLGVKGNTALARHVMALEARITGLERAIDRSLEEHEGRDTLSLQETNRWIQAHENFLSSHHWMNRPAFFGEVVSVSGGLLQQKTNRNGETTCHALAKMNGTAKVGDIAEVHYFVGGCDIFVKQQEKGLAR